MSRWHGKSEQDEAITDVVTALDMPLGDILLAALQKDPQALDA